MRNSESAQSTRTASAYRQAGYAVATHTIGLRLHPLALRPGFNFARLHGTQDPLRSMRLAFASSRRTQLQIEAAVVICLAGPLAEKQHDPASWRLELGEADRRKAAELVGPINEDPELAAAHLRSLELRAQRLVATRWPAINQVASELIVRGSLSVKEVRTLVAGEAL